MVPSIWDWLFISSQNAFSFYLVIIRQLLYKLQATLSKLRSLPQHFPCCRLWDHMVDFCRFLTKASWMQSTVSMLTCGCAVPLQIHPSFSSLRLSQLQGVVTVCHSEVSLNSFCQSHLVKPQAALCLLHLRCYFSLIVVGAPLMVDMLQSVLPTKTWWVSLLFSSCFVVVSIIVSKRH